MEPLLTRERDIHSMSQHLTLTVQNGSQAGQVFQLSAGSFTIGRTADNSVQLSDAAVSKRHARLTIQASGASIEDTGSSNGTFVNGRRITAATPLKSGDMLQIGTTIQLKTELSGGAMAIMDLDPTYKPAAGGAQALPVSPFSLIMRQGPQPGQAFSLAGNAMTIGRTANNPIHISEAAISKQHARITMQGNQLFIQDLGSSNGTFVNGQRITGPVAFVPGDIIQVGTSVILEVQGPGGVAAPAQAAPAYAAPAVATSSKGPMGVVIALAVVVVLAGFGAAAWFAVQGNTPPTPEPAAPATAAPTATPLPTDTPTATSVPAVVMDLDVDKTTVQLGQCATLRWQVDNAKEVRLDGEKVADEASHKVCPQEASKTYRLTALSLDGETSEESVTLTVPPTPLPPPGVDIEFAADKTSVIYGDCTTLRWRVENANEVRRETKKVGLTGSEEVCPTEAASTYNLLVQTLDGENVEQAVTIVVPPTPVPTNTPLPPTATPRPQPQAQNPIIDKFIADQNSLNQGGCTTLRWQVRNAQTVRLDGTQVANTGNQRVCPTASSNTYNLAATGSGGGSTQSSLTLAVAAPTPTPVIIIVQPTPVYVQPAPASGSPVVNVCGQHTQGVCFYFRWDIRNVKEIYLDGEGITGQGSTEICDASAQPGERGNFRIVHLDGRVENINTWPRCN